MKRVLIVGIAGSDRDFLASVPVLTAYLRQFPEINENFSIYQALCPSSETLSSLVEKVRFFKPDILALKRKYFEVAERTGWAHATILNQIASGLWRDASDDFDLSDYFLNRMFDAMPEEWLMEQLEEMK